VIDWLVIMLLVALMVRVFARRKNTAPPNWMGRLQTADARLSFRLGLLLFLVMPTMITVGAYLARHGDPWWHSLPFLLLTLLLVKLGVHTRREAAKAAARLGIGDTRPTGVAGPW
jgi:purine-cytosine permease-like protein